VLPLAALILSTPPVGSAGPESSEDRYPVVEAPRALAADEAGLDDDAIVVGVVSGGEARAYPIRALWHEGLHTVNDTLGDVPVGVSMCPLAGVGLAYDRRVGDETLELGTLIEVDRGSLALYDEGSGSHWGLLTGQAVEGPRQGQELGRVSSLFTTWGRWRALHPESTVYVDPEKSGEDFVLDGERLRLMIVTGRGPVRPRDWVIGVTGEKGAAVLGRALASVRLANLEVEGRPVVVFMTEDRTTSVVWGRDIDGRTLTFRAEGDRMMDEETGSTWEPLAGEALSGPMEGRRLPPVPYVTGFWHAWKAHFPETALLDPAAD
jgi:hypothetical protein